jgi:O-antigen/teichoic acid export membrane protein
VQAPEAGRDLMAELHGASILRGIAVALLLLGAAPLFAAFPDGAHWTTFAALALVPLLRGFAHLDARRDERGFRYGRIALVEAGATGAMLAALLPAVAVLGDHRAMVAVLGAHALAYALLSHLVATDAYRPRFARAPLVRIWRFGAPLLLNSLLLFLTFYADRMIVAAAFDWATLAVYGIGLQLALLPAQIVGRAAASLLLPKFRLALLSGRIAPATRAALGTHLALAAAFAIGFTLLAPPMIALVYGAGFRPEPALAAALAMAAAFRILRTPLSQLAVATGRTGDPARANLFRAMALVPAGAAAALGFPLAAVAGAAALGEAAATLRAVHIAAPWIFGIRRQELAV